MSYTRSLAITAGLVLAALALPHPMKAQEVVLRMHTFLPPISAPVQKFLQPWAETVERESGNRIKVELYPAMQLGGRPQQLIDQVRDGVVDIVWTVPGYTPGRFVKTEVFELPFIHTNPVATNLALQDFAERHGEEYRGIKVLLLHVHTGAAFHSYDPIRSVGDVAGMKIRTPSRVGGWFLEAMGATPIGAPVPKVPELLSKRVVDGVMIPFEIAHALKTHEMVDYHTVLAHPRYPRPNTSVFLFAMNRARYEALPPDLQAVIDSNAGRNIARQAGELWEAIEIPGEVAAAESGELLALETAEVEVLKATMEAQVHERWIAEVADKGIDGRGLISEARLLIQRHTE